jgi:hypothetical protein
MTARRKILTILVYALALVALIFVLSREKKTAPQDILEVPLGVEEAVIITSDSRPIEPKPYAWGVGVNVRIAAMREVEGVGRVYDLRYIVNRAGDFDIKDYLRYSDGKPADTLPSFKVRGLERLSKDIETRIAETEDTSVEMRAWYYETLAILALVWIAWLLVLIFWRRPKPHETPVPTSAPTLADQIRAYLAQFESGKLDAREQARLEMLIFRQWRQERAWAGQPMATSVAAFGADPEVAEAYAALENWLHRAERSASPGTIADTVRSRLEKAAPKPAAGVTA